MLLIIVTIILTICLAYCKKGGNSSKDRVDKPTQQPKVDSSSGNKNQVETTRSNDNEGKQVAQTPQVPPVNQVIQPEQPKNMTPDLAAPQHSALRSVVTAMPLTIQKPVVVIDEKPKKGEETVEKKAVKGKPKGSVHLAATKDKKETTVVVVPIPLTKHSIRAPTPNVKEEGTQKTYLSADYNDEEDDTIGDAPSIKQGKDSKENSKDQKKARTPVPSVRSAYKKPPNT